MNEATPDWRTFATRGPTPAVGTSALEVAATSASGRADSRFGAWLVLGLVGAGAAALGAACLVLLLLLGGPASGLLSPAPVELSDTARLPASLDEGATIDDVARSPIVVDVGGGVAVPGLVRLTSGDRVGDAIAAAGGFAPRADLVEAARVLNLAEPLTDGGKVFVPLLGMSGAEAPSGGQASGRIDINAADQALLETLPGIGPVTATRIIEARAERRFGSVEELRGRGVVGNAVFEKLKDLVTAG